MQHISHFCSTKLGVVEAAATFFVRKRSQHVHISSAAATAAQHHKHQRRRMLSATISHHNATTSISSSTAVRANATMLLGFGSSAAVGRHYCGALASSISTSSSSSSSLRLQHRMFSGLPVANANAIGNHRSQQQLCPNLTTMTPPPAHHPQNQPRRSLSVQEINANLHLITETPRNVKHDANTLRLHNPIDRPLCIMPAWLLAKRKPLNKYAEIYLQLGFDVLTIKISPWQLLWPAKGSQLVGRDVVQFLHHNTHFAPLFVHGFSVGAYVWGECLVQLAADPQRYGHIVRRIVGQVWDSAADITEIPVGVPKAVFPNNPRLNRALGNYMRYHLRTFHDIATQHYLRSSQQFHQNLVRSPALMFVSEDDPVGSVSSNQAVRQDWLRLGMRCDWKCWSRSEHVMHFMRHREEYLGTLMEHLGRLELLEHQRDGDGGEEPQQQQQQLRAKL